MAIEIRITSLKDEKLENEAERLDAPYSFDALDNLTSYELLFLVMLDETEKQLGFKAPLGVSLILLGENFIKVPGKMKTATRGTSVASVLSRKLIRYQFKKAILPTLTKKSIQSFRFSMTRGLGAFVGRWIPYVGVAILAYDVITIIYKTVNRYNSIVNNEDKIE